MILWSKRVTGIRGKFMDIIRILEYLKELTEKAIRARKNAAEAETQHRAYYVGVSALLSDGSILAAGNLMPEKGGHKTCSEQSVMGCSLGPGCTVEVFVIVAEPQQDKESSCISPTLHPCGDCRRFFSQTPKIVKPDAIVATLSPDGTLVEVHTVEQILYLHTYCQLLSVFTKYYLSQDIQK
jgi:cytidine deaminase